MSDQTEKAVMATAKVYEARNDLKQIAGDRYPEIITQAQKTIGAVMHSESCEALPAVLKIVRELTQANRPVLEKVIILAAFVEMIEPSETAED